MSKWRMDDHFPYKMTSKWAMWGLSTNRTRELDSTRWAPSSYKWSYKPYKWPYNWVTGVITSISGVITLLITGTRPTFTTQFLIGIISLRQLKCSGPGTWTNAYIAWFMSWDVMSYCMSFPLPISEIGASECENLCEAVLRQGSFHLEKVESSLTYPNRSSIANVDDTWDVVFVSPGGDFLGGCFVLLSPLQGFGGWNKYQVGEFLPA